MQKRTNHLHYSAIVATLPRAPIRKESKICSPTLAVARGTSARSIAFAYSPGRRILVAPGNSFCITCRQNSRLHNAIARSAPWRTSKAGDARRPPFRASIAPNADVSLSETGKWPEQQLQQNPRRTRPAPDLHTALLDCGPETRFVPVINNAVILRHAANTYAELVWWHADKVRDVLASLTSPAPCDIPFAFLPSSDGNLYIAFDVPCNAPQVVGLPRNERPTPLRRSLEFLDPAQRAVASQAKCLIQWHRSNRFCGTCGHPTAIAGERATVRQCSNLACGTQHERVYPRINPSIIVLVTRNDGSECLMGRKASWPPGRFSPLAGFCELGETLEETVVREVREESGVIVDPLSITYHSSQAWPHPTASMLSAFYANALESKVEIIDDELECARWFSRSWLRSELDMDPKQAEVSIPGQFSVARSLLFDWLNQGSDHS